MNADWKYAETKQSLFYAAMVKQLGFESLLLLKIDGGSNPSRRPKAKNLRFQHLRRFVMLLFLPRHHEIQALGLAPKMQQRRLHQRLRRVDKSQWVIFQFVDHAKRNLCASKNHRFGPSIK